MEDSGFRCPGCGRLHFDVPERMLAGRKCWLKANGKRKTYPCGQCQLRKERGDCHDEDVWREVDEFKDRYPGDKWWRRSTVADDDDLLD